MILADLHIHSPFSRATSKESHLQGLAFWARVKGLGLLGTGDFTHPEWFAHLRENLTEAEPGLYRLKGAEARLIEGMSPAGESPRFLLSGEISSIYKRGGKVRKVHNLIFAPSLEAAARFNERLGRLGNVKSDGRPILGLDSKDLLELQLEVMPEGFLVPAHIWTPWFSLFGSKSGFDSIEECFGDLAEHIFAVETGLSSDPWMNRLVSGLDGVSLISNSDCHSPSKLGREANLLDCEPEFAKIKQAIRDPAQGLKGTVEFYPDEGKYHLDGHRKCEVRFTPEETKKHAGRCPVCQKPLTVGVLSRVMELADRKEPLYPEGQEHFESLIPLAEVLSEILGVGAASKAVTREYVKLVNLFGSEFACLREVEPERLAGEYSPLLGLAMERMRKGEVFREGGFDGEYGRILLFQEKELRAEEAEIHRLLGRKRRFA